MTLKIGRVEIGAADARPAGVTTVTDFTFGPDGLTINGTVSLASQAKASAAMQRILGLLDADSEPVVPVTWSDGPADVPGFYRVVGGQIGAQAGLMPEGVVSFSLTLARVAGAAAPLLENVVTGTKRLDSDPGITAQAFMALPSTVKGFEIGANLTPSFYTRSTVEGDMTVFVDASNTLFDATSVPSFYVDPGDWYNGAATLKVDGEVVVGRQVRNLPTDWQIDNGLIRISGAAGGITVQRRLSTGVVTDTMTVKPYRRVDFATLYYFDDPHTITVLRNLPEAVTVRLTYDVASAIAGARFKVTVDIEVRRGARAAAWYMDTRGSYQWGFRIDSWGAATWTAAIGGVYNAGRVLATDNDAGVSVPTGATVDIQTQLAGPGKPLIMGLGYYGSGSGGTGSTGIDTPQSVINQWAAAQVENVDAVVR